MNETRNAKSVTGLPKGDLGEDAFFTQVGFHFPYHNKNAPVVEMITVTGDLPGLHCNLERVRVWGPDALLLWEGPLHNLEGVSYV
jgi:hypothetical protein